MFFSCSLSKARRAALRFAVCVMAVCLSAGIVSEAAAREAAPSQSSSSPVFTRETPCPQGITVEVWEKAPTLWRMAYNRCKPEGAPERYEIDPGDLQDFVRAIGSTYPRLGGFSNIFLRERDSRTYRLVASMAAKTVRVPEAETITADILKRMLMYLETNGHDPKEEKMVLTAETLARTEQGIVWVFAIYDRKTGGIRHKTKL